MENRQDQKRKEQKLTTKVNTSVIILFKKSQIEDKKTQIESLPLPILFIGINFLQPLKVHISSHFSTFSQMIKKLQG